MTELRQTGVRPLSLVVDSSTDARGLLGLRTCEDGTGSEEGDED
jgi:hypothetical protein